MFISFSDDNFSIYKIPCKRHPDLKSQAVDMAMRALPARVGPGRGWLRG